MPKPLILRRLTGQGGKLIDEKSLPPNNIVFNPSIAYPHVYMRGNKQTATDEQNYIILYNIETKNSTTIQGLENILQKNQNRYRGLEDLRICNYKNRLWFVGTCTHANNTMNSECVIGYFNNAKTNIERISHIPLGKPPVKNICPFVYDNKLCIFDIYKKEIYEIEDQVDEKTGKWEKFVATNCRQITAGAGLDIENFRGSTSPVHLHGSTYGCIVHDIIYNDSPEKLIQLAYLHHWVEIDMNMAQVTYVSSPFWVNKLGVEFISGLHIAPDGENVELYMGVDDQIAVKYVTKLAFLRNGR